MSIVVIPRSGSSALLEHDDLFESLYNYGLTPLRFTVFDVIWCVGVHNFNAYDGVVATSKNGVWALWKSGCPKNKRFYVVGSGSLSFARSLGYTNCIQASQSSAKTLALDVLHDFKLKTPAIFYMRGEKVAFNLEAFLSTQKISLHTFVGYGLRKNKNSISALKDAMGKMPWGVVVLSREMACLMTEVMPNDCLSKTRFFLLSSRLKDIFQKKKCQNMYVAALPEIKSLITLLKLEKHKTFQ